MSTPENPADTQAASLAAALIERIGPLAQAAADAKRGIAADREQFSGAGEADALIDTVVERVDELEADCRRLMRILVGFEAAAAQPQVEVPAAEPTPAAGASGISTFPGAAAAEGAGDEPIAAAPPTGEPVIGTPPTGEPVIAPPPGDEPVAAPPPSGEPVVTTPPGDQPAAEETVPVEPAPDGPAAVEADEPGPEVEPDADPGAQSPASDEPVQVSEGVRLLATQMSVAGASSEDIARRLHNDFGVENADQLIAQLFGSRA